MNIEQIELKLSRRQLSPLFARLASEYLIAGRIPEARDLCLAGLERYPSYSTANLILARCFAAKGEYSTALSFFQHVIKQHPNSHLLKNLQAEWQRFTEPVTEPSAPVDSMPTQDSLVVEHEETAEAILPTNEPQMTEDISSAEVATTARDEEHHTEDVSSLGQEPVQLEFPTTPSEEIPQSEISPESIQDVQAASDITEDRRIVSRTLAEIFAAQGAYGEAIITYQLLKRKKPELSGEFDERIKELEVKLQAKLSQQ
ncbi:MAG: tetratricopeptide repeat protein [Ignavibacteria bacterium]|nr:tetratricopeptide repeat protein [Ignavibacteria bacterium]